MFEQICNLENLVHSYYRARRMKRYFEAVSRFDFTLENNLIKLRDELVTETYVPLPYHHFIVTDPKTRHIAAPSFRDRIVHHCLISAIEPIFEKTFITDSYACRKDKGTHFAAKRVKKFLIASRTFYGKNIDLFVLQCDIRKYFASISWDVLLKIINRKIACPQTLKLIEKIVTTHRALGKENIAPVKDRGQMNLFGEEAKTDNWLEEVVSVKDRRGLPIGNLTSQLFANVYLNELDQFVKQKLRVRWYARYMDDFLFIHPERKYLKKIKAQVKKFLKDELKLELHPNKVNLYQVSQGVPFVGYLIFYDHVLIRGKTLLRSQKRYRKKVWQVKTGKLTQKKLEQTRQSMLGHFKHADTYNLKKIMFKCQ